MKADYLRYIYECLSGENGLLGGEDQILNQLVSFEQDILLRQSHDISDEETKTIDCDMCNKHFDPSSLIGGARENV